jgi:hypothetical protein
MAGFEVTLNGRFWVTPEGTRPSRTCSPRRLYEVIRGKSPVWRQYLDFWDVQDTVLDFVAKKDRLCVLRLDPLDELPLPGIRTDLVWIRPAAVMVTVAVYFIVR